MPSPVFYRQFERHDHAAGIKAHTTSYCPGCGHGLAHKYIADAMLYGDRKPFVTALIVPDADWLRRYAEWKKIPGATVSELVADPQVLDYYARLVEETQKKAELAPYESVKKFVLLDHEFSMDQGEVTPTMKIRRRKVTERYKDRLEALYAGRE